MIDRRYALGWVALAVGLATGGGCSLIAAADRNLIPGEGGGGAGPVTSSTTGGGEGGDGHGGAGAGGIGGVGGMGGTGGTECTVARDCGNNECITYACDSGTCSEMPKRLGTKLARQTAGDCKVKQCNGAGDVEEVADDDDLPDDMNDCTSEACTSGTPTHPNLPVDTACGVTPGLVCDGQGTCVGCIDPEDCAGTDTECHTRKCTGGICGVDNAPAGTELLVQTAGDCQVAQCNGAGGIESADDNGDLPDDGHACTSDLCSNGTPSNSNVPATTACNEGSGTMCDGAGTCVECIGPADCPGVDDECQSRTCTLGVCGFDYTPSGTDLSTQTAGDCKKNVCDGAGSATVVNDDGDALVDGNTCTNDVCTAGVPTNPPVSNGTTCGSSLTCVGGACTGCATPSNCPGTDDECKTRTCTVGVCGFSFTASGTVTANQTTGNCQVNVCDGAGNIQSIPAPADLPVDNNQCTSDICTAGSPSNPLLPTNTPCNQAGGSFCSATGQCVACNQANQCPGSDTECHQRTCNGGTCGTAFVPAGTQTSAQTQGDCKVNQCDGSGNIVQANANSDVPADDGQQCTDEVCSAGTPGHPPKAINTACNQGGGAFCNGAGACVACNVAPQCPGPDTDCQTRACTLNVCGFTFASSGTPTSTQTPGDCKENQCNGAGGVVVANKDLDVPPDDGIQCTLEACSSGTPQHPPKPINTPCTQSGGAFCDGASACVECNIGSQCASLVCTAATHTCAAPSCTDGVENGSETDVDCGGSCPPCAAGHGCNVHADCAGGACNPATHTCAPDCTTAEAPGATCTSYCACMTSTCTDKFPSEAACIDACAGFVEAQICCRAYHCGNAMLDPVTHCPHAAGESLCP